MKKLKVKDVENLIEMLALALKKLNLFNARADNSKSKRTTVKLREFQYLENIIKEIKEVLKEILPDE